MVPLQFEIEPTTDTSALVCPSGKKGLKSLQNKEDAPMGRLIGKVRIP
jgi:hypothetical protein